MEESKWIRLVSDMMERILELEESFEKVVAETKILREERNKLLESVREEAALAQLNANLLDQIEEIEQIATAAECGPEDFLEKLPLVNRVRVLALPRLKEGGPQIEKAWRAKENTLNRWAMYDSEGTEVESDEAATSWVLKVEFSVFQVTAEIRATDEEFSRALTFSVWKSGDGYIHAEHEFFRSLEEAKKYSLDKILALKANPDNPKSALTRKV